MKQLSLLVAALMIAGASFACEGKGDKACCKKEAKTEKKACCKKGEAKDCQKDAAKKESKQAESKS